jgi:hypothetical protein
MIALLKPVRRKTCDKFMHYGTPIVVELKPGDCIGLRLLRHKRGDIVKSCVLETGASLLN